MGTGLHDGFGDGDLHHIGRRFRRHLPWALPLAAIAGVMLRAYYARLLRPGISGLVMLLSIVRAFGHFPLYGMLALFGVMWGFVLAGWNWLMARLRRNARAAADDSESILSRWLGPPIWFIVLPFIAMKLPSDGDIELPETVSRRRLLRWLPAVLALIFLFTDAVSEDTGGHVDRYWLAAVTSFWLADYLMVALRVAPVLRERRRSSVA